MGSLKGDDLLTIGAVTVGLRNGATVKEQFIARLVVANADTSQPKLSLYQVWMVSSSTEGRRTDYGGGVADELFHRTLLR